MSPKRHKPGGNLRPDGTERVVHERGEVVFAEDGKPARMIGTVLDITERKHAEQALHESEEHYRLLHQTMLQGVVYHDADGDSVVFKILRKYSEKVGGAPAQNAFGGRVQRNVQKGPSLQAQRLSRNYSPSQAEERGHPSPCEIFCGQIQQKPWQRH